MAEKKDHVEIRFHKAKLAMLPQLESVIMLNINMNRICDEVSDKYSIGSTALKDWVRLQIPAIEDDEEEEDDDE